MIAQKPTALQLIPAKLPEEKAAPADKATAEAVYEYEPDEETISQPAHAQHRDAALPRAARERGLRAGRAHERDGQRHATPAT